MSELWHRRAVFCDMLTGRRFRLRAAEMLERALLVESLGAPHVIIQRELENAAHMEWIAEKSEKGQILWGGRFDRHGRSAPGEA